MTQQQPNPQIVSQQQYSDFMAQAMGMPIGQPAQQLFQMPTPQAQAQRPANPVPNPAMMQNPASQVQQPNPNLMQTPAPQISNIAPPGSPRQYAYENMTQETSDFIKGMLDAAIPLMAQRAYESLSKEAQEALAEKYAKEKEEEKEEEEKGFFDGWLGGALLIAGGLGAGYLANEYLNSNTADEEDTMTAFDAIETLLS